MQHSLKALALHITPPTSLAVINAMDQSQFVATFGGVFEHSPWVAEAAWHQRPFACIDSLHAAMMGIIRRKNQSEQIAFLCKHPELAGKEAMEGQLTVDSQVEQASAGLSCLSAREVAQIQTMNHSYRRRHGFPFIICVRQYSKPEIFAEFERRIASKTDKEREEALAQVEHITRLRLKGLQAASPPPGKVTPELR